MYNNKKLKVKLTRLDGTVVEIEGDHEQVLQAVLALTPASSTTTIVVQPTVIPYSIPYVKYYPVPVYMDPPPNIFIDPINSPTITWHQS
jgi:hypothetical protein